MSERHPNILASLTVWVRRHAAANALLIGVIALIFVFAYLNSQFLTTGNFRNILIQSACLAVVAVPMALLLISGNVDLSVGSVLALGGVVTGLLLNHGMAIVPAILIGIAAGTAVGVINGILVTVTTLSPVIVTLGALTAVRGLAETLAPKPVFNFPEGFVNLGDGEVLGVPYLALVAAAAFLIGAIVMARFPLGRHVYAIGVNPEAAFLSGIRVKRIVFLLFVVTGAAAAMAGTMLAARLGSAPSGSLGLGFELEVLTAVILGGVAFTGGRGKIFGVLLGVLFLGILQNGLPLHNVPAATALMIKGGTLIVAAWLDWVSVRSEGLATLLRGVGPKPEPEKAAIVIGEGGSSR
ncbi:MAG: hypothetical protein BGO11_00820 [Solirubrobacterales bacterium 70-9]|nr:MAG: hypothetical protein BGO11_00820 [Solirubrobacterales bacterium 70-9]